MEGTELDTQLEDLETRVERLRSLYEQYFLGIEKIPPQVAQKDVDRRIHILRREQIRNTARRFKLQTIIQRYNTFQQYWMRIMREIENGTYRRHVLRAERTVGVTDLLTAAERKRQALPEPEPKPTTTPPESPTISTAPGTPLVPPQNDSLETRAPLSPSPKAVRAEIERQLGLLVEDELDGLDTKGLSEVGRELDDPLLSSMPPPLRRKPTAKPIARRSARPSGNSAKPSTQQVSNRPSGSPSKAAPSSAATRTQSRSLRPSRTVESPPNQRTSGGGGLKLPASSAIAGRGLPPPLRQTAPRGAPMKVPSSPIIAVTRQPAVNAPPKPEAAPAPASQRRSAAPASSRSSEKPKTKGLPTPAAKAPINSPEVRQPPPPNTKKPEPAPSSSSTPLRARSTSDASNQRSNTLDRARVERLAEKLRAARQQTNESAPVSVDALAKKLQASAEQLREKHKGRQVDFEVIIRDGKAILKPVIR